MKELILEHQPLGKLIRKYFSKFLLPNQVKQWCLVMVILSFYFKYSGFKCEQVKVIISATKTSGPLEEKSVTNQILSTKLKKWESLW